VALEIVIKLRLGMDVKAGISGTYLVRGLPQLFLFGEQEVDI
jgi:hypothetical protein